MSLHDASASILLPDIEEFEVAVAVIQQQLATLAAFVEDASGPFDYELGDVELAFCKAVFDELEIHPEANSFDLDTQECRKQLEYVARHRQSCYLLEDLIKQAEKLRMVASGEVLMFALDGGSYLAKAGLEQNLPPFCGYSRTSSPVQSVQQLLTSKRLRH